MSRWVDLHVHTNQSDGGDAPDEVVGRAAELGMAALAITDHDTVSALPEAARAARRFGIALMPGTEVSVEFRRAEVHVVGLGVDPEDPVLAQGLTRQRAARLARAECIVEKLRARGLSLSLPDVLARAPGGLVGRMHVATALHEAGVVTSVQQAFDRFLKPGRPGYVPKPMATVDEAIGWIHAAGGLAFLAHPGIGRSTKRHLEALLSQPFDGIEAYHSRHSPGEREGFIDLARERGLLVAGGSDCHGRIKGAGPEMGKVRVPYSWYMQVLDTLDAVKTRRRGLPETQAPGGGVAGNGDSGDGPD